MFKWFVWKIQRSIKTCKKIKWKKSTVEAKNT